jgi:hypothetical protein
MKTVFLNRMSAALIAVVSAVSMQAQVVDVTASLDTNTVPAGGSTTLRIFARIIPAQRTNAERIFSWYVDVLNTNSAAATANYGAMLKTASDKDPSASSTGTPDGANRRGIYDTFMNLPGAGVNAPVELMAIPVTGAATGQTRFRIQAGTGAGLSSDFLVAPVSGSEPLTGGNYALAETSLTVLAGATVPSIRVSMTVTNAAGGAKGVTLNFPTVAGFNYTAQFRDQLAGGTGWQPLPGAPHNSGTTFHLSTAARGFYRVAITPAN